MSRPADVGDKDEALKALMARFREAPDSPVFVDLADALLARGHATEALTVAEHGLSLKPMSIPGRLKRASALMAIGRANVAYVELRRVLAIEPTNRRGRRLLGQVFVEAGLPAKAAELLKQRSPADTSSSDIEPTEVARIAFKAEDTKPDRPDPATTAKNPAGPGSAFSRLGLAAATPLVPIRQVEVTQIIRRRKRPQSSEPKDELAKIDEPIVDATQPGRMIQTTSQNPKAPSSLKEPPPLFSHPSDAAPTPRQDVKTHSEALFPPDGNKTGPLPKKGSKSTPSPNPSADLDDEPLFEEEDAILERAEPTIPNASANPRNESEPTQVQTAPSAPAVVHRATREPKTAPNMRPLSVPAAPQSRSSRRTEPQKESLSHAQRKVLIGVAMFIVLYLGLLGWFGEDTWGPWFFP